MANPLQTEVMPEAPEPMNALVAGKSSAGPQPGSPQIPTPSHQQTVAALRHFQAIMSELRGLLKHPDLGKSDLKSEIIDGATKLVAKQIISPAQAVAQLSQVPDRPFDQRTWLAQQYTQAEQARDLVLDHHRMGNPAQGDENSPPVSGPENHMSDMAGLMGHYQGGGNA